MPSPAMCVAIIALVMSMTGGAIAATIISSSSQIKNGAVTGSDVRNGTIRSTDIAAGTRRALKGVPGPAGPTGATGPAGSTLAYAHVKADGSLDVANSKNVASSAPGSGAGRYCFKLGFTPKSTIATADWTPGADGVMAQVIPDQTTIDLACGAGSSAAVFLFDDTGAAVNNGFYVVFE